jgi:hypothetical protein
MNITSDRQVAALLLTVGLTMPMAARAQDVFQGGGDVGAVLHKGAVAYDAATETYKVAGSGENVWGTADGFFFVWKKITGEVMLRVMVLGTRNVTVLTRLFGGQGAMNVNSWSPDSRRLAFVRFQYVP